MRIIQIILALCAIIAIFSFIHGIGAFTNWYSFPLYTHYPMISWVTSIIGLFALTLQWMDVFTNAFDACYYYWMKFVNACSRNER